MKLNVASNDGQLWWNNIPIRVASGEWRVAKNEGLIKLSVVDQSILMCGQDIHVMNGIFVNTPMEGLANFRHSPLAIRHSKSAYLFLSGYKSRITKNAAR
ncbi:MAG: hypothetical protein RL040_1298 [Bacteroidota bacterium]|jgi:hypothetical protein